jgi:ADYC domain
MSPSHIAVVSSLLGFATACGAAEDVPAASTTQDILTDESCPQLICGNSPYLGLYPFWEADETGVTPSVNGFVIDSVRNAGGERKLAIDGFLMGGKPLGGGAPQPITRMTIVKQDSSMAFHLTIDPGPWYGYYESLGGGSPIPSYRIRYYIVDHGKRSPDFDLCRSDGPVSLAREAIVFQGDRYDAKTGAVIATGKDANPWFNIACKDDSLWKLALMRHVEAASDATHFTAPTQRQALLRSIRADYCGDGKAWTQLGTAVDWLNSGKWLTRDVAKYPDVEAMWTGDGATCLTKPRIATIATPFVCNGVELPECPASAQTPVWTGDHSVITYVP